MSAPDRACPDYPNECVHPWAHARTYAEVKATQTKEPEMTADDPSDCAFCAAPALDRLPNGADAGCPLHGTARVYQPQEDALAGRLAVALRQRDQLFSTLADVLGNFHEKGHPGTPCIRTGWVREETFRRWHGVLAGIVASDGPGRD